MDKIKENITKIWSGRDVVKIFTIVFASLGLLVLILKFLKPELVYVSLVVDFGLFVSVLVTFILFLKKKKVSWREFGFIDVKIKWFLLSFALIFGVVFVGGFLSKVWSSVLGLDPGGDIFSLEMIIGDKMWLNVLNLKLGVALLVPFAEELLFRGLLFRYIRQEKSFIFSAILSSVLFSLLHFNLGSFPFTFLLGFTTAFIFERTKSMFYPFLVHMGVNTFTANLVLFSVF